MRLTEICAERPGVLPTISIPAFSPGLNVVYGPNGCGKTTLLQFIRGVFAQIGAPWSANASAAERFTVCSISLESDVGALRVIRQRREGHRDTVAIVGKGLAPGAIDELRRASLDVERRPVDLVHFVDVGSLHRTEALAACADRLSRFIASDSQNSGRDEVWNANWNLVIESLRQQREQAVLAMEMQTRRRARAVRAWHVRLRWINDRIAQHAAELETADLDLQAAVSDLRKLEDRHWIRVDSAGALSARPAGVVVGDELARGVSESPSREQLLRDVLRDLAQQRWRFSLELAADPLGGSHLEEDRRRVDRCEMEVLHQLRAARRQGLSAAAGNAPPINGALKREVAVNEHHAGIAAAQGRVRRLSDRVRALSVEQSGLWLRRDRLAAAAVRAADRGHIEASRRRAAGIETDLAAVVAHRAAAHSVEVPPTPAAAVLDCASDYFARLTAGRYVALHRDKSEATLLAKSPAEESTPVAQLSRGTTEQAAMALRLAILSSLAQAGVAWPAFWDEALVDSDEERLQAAAALLAEVCRTGAQIILFTCREHVAGVLAAHGATMHRFESRPEAARSTPIELTPAVPMRELCTAGLDAPRWSQLIPGTPAYHHPAETGDDDKADEETDDAAAAVRVHPSSPFWLQLNSPLNLVPSLGLQMEGRLRSLGMNDVGDLLQFDPGLKIGLLREMQIAIGQVHVWRAEARLLTSVPGLTARDAQLLVSCGLLQPRDLAASDVDELSRRIDRLRGGQLFRWRPGLDTSPRRETVQQWIAAARRSPAGSVPASPETTAVAAGTATSLAADAIEVSEREQPETVRFRLQLDSPVVDAPSIGTKTARLLRRAGIMTVSDLLGCDAPQVATRLRHRRITSETIVQWQQQATLMCTVPDLRCADAGLLVACGITSPRDLRRISSSALFSILSPLMASTEGRRILRTTQPPTAADVTRWTETVEESRVRRAA